MTSFTAVEDLVAAHPGDVLEINITHGAGGNTTYRASVTMFAFGDQHVSYGGVIGTGSGTAATITEAIRQAVIAWAPS